MTTTMIIMRGIPGSGKSTTAKKMQQELGGKIFSTDDYWTKDNSFSEDTDYAKEHNLAEYRKNFALDKLKEAHEWNRARVYEHLNTDRAAGNCVFIDNTNITAKEIIPYIKMGIQFECCFKIVEPDNDFWRKNKWLMTAAQDGLNYYSEEKNAFVAELMKRNVHGVPEETLHRMIAKWEEIDLERLIGQVYQEMHS